MYRLVYETRVGVTFAHDAYYRSLSQAVRWARYLMSKDEEITSISIREVTENHEITRTILNRGE